jgi:predicted nucleic acid-binding protein
VIIKRSLYWDTSNFLCFLNKDEEARRKICEDVLQRAAMDEVRILTSTYTIVEVIRPKKRAIPGSRTLTPEQIAKIKSMFRWPFITTIELDERTALFASDLARDYGLAPADAVHAASAILWKADELQAWDRDFNSVSHLIATGQPRYLSVQTEFEGMEKQRLGPAPEDFEKGKE